MNQQLYRRQPELWLDVKDNDYYSRKLSEMSCFAPAVLGLGDFDKIIRELYVQPMLEQLNRPSILGLIELLPTPPPPKRKWRIFGWFR